MCGDSYYGNAPKCQQIAAFDCLGFGPVLADEVDYLLNGRT